MPFRFRLRSVLRQRLYFLKKAQSALAAAQLQHQRNQQDEEQLRHRIKQQRQLLDEQQCRGMGVAHYLACQDYALLLERELSAKENELIKSGREVDERRKQMLDCEKAVKMLECLEDKERENYRSIQKQKEQRELDEIATLRGGP